MENRNFSNLAGETVIKVFGVGGGGNNALNNMVSKNLQVKYVAVNTDVQAIIMSKADECIQIGPKLTQGLGAGADPNIGRDAAEESEASIKAALDNVNLLFITAGMGGGTGTGAAPVIARIARKMGILTIAVVTTPFNFEGKKRMDNAQIGIHNLRKYVDTILVISNEKLLEHAAPGVSVVDAFILADDVLCQGVQGITDLIRKPYLINLDFADIKTVIKDKGYAHMGIGTGEGPDKVYNAILGAVGSQLITSNISGADSVIMNIVGGKDLTLKEFGQASNIIKEIVDPKANIIIGTGYDEQLTGKVKVTFIATGFDKSVRPSVDSADAIENNNINAWADNETSIDVVSRAINLRKSGGENPQASVKKDAVPDSRFNFDEPTKTRPIPPIRDNNFFNDRNEDEMENDFAPQQRQFNSNIEEDEISKNKTRQRPKYLDFLSNKK